jgi:predicted MPP superfamily phosphohydrolase
VELRTIWRAVIGFLIVVLTLMGGSWLIVGSVIAPVIPGGWRSIGAGAFAFSFFPLALFLGVRGSGLYAGRWMRVLVFRPFWYAQLLLLSCAIAVMLGVLVGLPFGFAGAFGRFFTAAAAAAFTLMALAGYIGSRRLMRRDLDVSHPDVATDLEGFRIVQVSDLHAGPHSRRDFLHGVAEAVRAARGDIVVVTGDLIDDFPGDVSHFARVVGAFEAPLGIFAVPGNHDIYAGWPEVRTRLEQLPVTVLVNESRTIERGNTRVTLVGTGDPAGGRSGYSALGSPNLPLAFSTIPAGTFVVALAHNPGLWPVIAHRGIPLTLSGHTHWGQLAVPSRNWCFVSVFLELAMGWHRSGPSLLWISPGTGYWGIPFRIGARPEVTVLTLRRGPAEIRETAYLRI